MLSILIYHVPWGKFLGLPPGGGVGVLAITSCCFAGKGLVSTIGWFGHSFTYCCTSLRHGQSLV